MEFSDIVTFERKKINKDLIDEVRQAFFIFVEGIIL